MNDLTDLEPEDNLPAGGDPVTELIERYAREHSATVLEATESEIASLCTELMNGKEYSEKEKAVLPVMVKTLLNLRLKELRKEKS